MHAWVAVSGKHWCILTFVGYCQGYCVVVHVVGFYCSYSSFLIFFLIHWRHAIHELEVRERGIICAQHHARIHTVGSASATHSTHLSHRGTQTHSTLSHWLSLTHHGSYKPHDTHCDTVTHTHPSDNQSHQRFEAVPGAIVPA